MTYTASLILAIFFSFISLIISSCVPKYEYVKVMHKPKFNTKNIKNISILGINSIYKRKFRNRPNYIDECEVLRNTMSSNLEESLTNDSTYRIIESRNFVISMNKQVRDMSGRLNPNTAAEIGRIIGVDAIIFGDFTCDYVRGTNNNPWYSIIQRANIRIVNTKTSRVIFTKNYPTDKVKQDFYYFPSISESIDFGKDISIDFFKKLVPHEENERRRIR